MTDKINVERGIGNIARGFDIQKQQTKHYYLLQQRQSASLRQIALQILKEVNLGTSSDTDRGCS